MDKNLRKTTITITAQTAYHLRALAGISGPRALGRVVDELVRESQKKRTTQKKGKQHETF